MRGGRKREENQVYTALHSALLSVCHALEKGGSECKGNSNSLKYLLVAELFKKERLTNNLLIRLRSMQRLLGQCLQACFEVFLAAPFAMSTSPLRLFPFLFFFSSLKKITLWQGFHPFHE